MAANESKKEESKALVPQAEPILPVPVENTNKNLAPKVLAAQVRRTETFSGPLPHPDHLERYGQIIPNGAERIFNLAENQAGHRMNAETLLIKADIRRSDLGLLYGFIIALVVTGSGVWITLQDKSPAGFITMITPLASIIGLFVYNRQTQAKPPEKPKPPVKRKKK